MAAKSQRVGTNPVARHSSLTNPLSCRFPEPQLSQELGALPSHVQSQLLSPGRLKALGELDALGHAADRDLDRLTRLAADALGAPMGLLCVVGETDERFASVHGLGGQGRPLGLGAFTLTESAPCLVLPDTAADARFSDAMRGPARFFAGTPVFVHGEKLGVLCVMDHGPRTDFDATLCHRLVDLAGVAGSLLELKREAAVRARMASDLMREKWRHALTLEAGKVGSWVFNLLTGMVSGNDMLRQMYGLPAEGPIRIDDLLAATEPADAEAFMASLRESTAQQADFAAEFRVVSGRRLSARGRVYERDEVGRPRVMMGITIDMTEAREAAEHTRHLLLELNHRVKNTLAMTQSIARQTLRQKPDPQDFIDSFSGRIRTLAEAHALLADRDWAGIGLLDLVQSQVAPYALSVGDRLVVAGADTQLPPDHALGLGIILHELASNAARYGALSGPNGRVVLSWTISDTLLSLDWVESGGPAVSGTPNIGLGARLIHRSLDKIIASQVQLDFLPGGVEAHIRLPLD